MGARYDYVAIGHVTVDLIEDHPDGPRRQPGGGAFYSALQAARLGLRTLVVTKGVPAQIEALLEPYARELEVHVLPSESTTTLATWGSGQERVQQLRAWAGPMDERPASTLEKETSIVHLAPVARETPARTWIQAEFVGLTPQGLVREWEANGRIRSAPLQREMLPGRIDAAVLNAGERADCAPLLEQGAPTAAAVVAVTAGVEPIELRLSDGSLTRVPPVAVGRVREDLGAGDIFAAAFFIALRDGKPAASAARFASAAAAVKVAGLAGAGAAAIGSRRDVERLLGDVGR